MVAKILRMPSPIQITDEISRSPRPPAAITLPDVGEKALSRRLSTGSGLPTTSPAGELRDARAWSLSADSLATC